MNIFEPVVRHQPGEFRSALALGLAMTRASRIDAGIDQLRRVVQSHPGSVEAWDCLLTGLDESGQVDILEEEIERLPSAVSESARLSKHRARVAQGRQPIEGGRQPLPPGPYGRARQPGRRVPAQPAPCATWVSPTRPIGSSSASGAGMSPSRNCPLYEQAAATPDLGIRPHAELYQRIAAVRERMELPEEAGAWHRLVLDNDPNNEVSRAALARLARSLGKDEG